MSKPSDYHILPEVSASSVDNSGTHRPVHFSDIVGQSRLIERLTTHLNSAVTRHVQPGHILLDGGPGLGKTTVGRAVAGELAARGVRCSFHQVTAQALPTVRKLVVQLAQLEPGDVLFVDELQSLKEPVQTCLLTALEDGAVTVEGAGKGPAQQFALPPITVVAATTHPGKIIEPLRDRFRFVGHIEPYLVDDLQLVVLGYCERAGIDITWDAAEVIAKASRFTPRRAIRLTDACRDWLLQVDADAKLDRDAALQGLEYSEVDQYGLEQRDHRVLATLCEQYVGGPVGLAPLGASLGMHQSELRDDIEPYLLRAGLLQLLPTGRAATFATYAVLGLKRPPLAYGLR